MKRYELGDTDRNIINNLQGGFPISERPYADAARQLGLSEAALIDQIAALVDAGVLSRFGPMFNAEKLGGAITLCALKVPPADFEKVAGQVNRFRQVAHNYARDHELNMWFVIACERREEIAQIIAQIETITGLKVYDFPKSYEFFVGLKVSA